MTHPAILTGIAMVAFAGNSVLCRLALSTGLIDAASFSMTRTTSGAATLTLLALLAGRGAGGFTVSWRAAAALAGYLVSFSYGYLSVTTATGALILFGTVQLTMLTAAWRSGERFGSAAWCGLTLALAGLAYLLAPGLEQPSTGGALLMMVSGLCWGLYSLTGRQTSDPMAATTGNFLLAVPVTIVLCAPQLLTGSTVSAPGLLLATASGALASACGYAVWFAALPHLSSAQGAVVQLTVPVIAAVGGAVLLAEPLSLRLLLASAATLGGIWLVLRQRLPASAGQHTRQARNSGNRSRKFL
ncbi:MAG: DMT family transporter [Pseudomonadales bacterium]